MEAAIRFSQNSSPRSSDQRFLRVDVTGKSFSLCQITGLVRDKVKYDVIHASTKVPAFRAFDWHPTNESLIAVGQSGGEATLLNIADGHHDSISFSVRSQRLCNAVALSTQNLIAVGLDKVRTDFCLNIWDFTQRLPTNTSKGFSNAEPLHKLAAVEHISSLKFYNSDPQLLVAGVKGQIVRLYDLREPNSSNGLQFQTKCVHNIVVDNLDNNYFASCYPSNGPLVCVWDRRMISRVNTSPVNFSGTAQAESKQPEASLELQEVVNNPGIVWSLRFSKARRRCLGVLSNIGEVKTLDFGLEHVSTQRNSHDDSHQPTPWHEAEPQDIFLADDREIERPFPASVSVKEQKRRVVSFDFTTSSTRFGEPRVIVLTGEGDIRMTHLHPRPEPACMSSTGFFCKGSKFLQAPSVDQSKEGVARSLNHVRRAAEPRNALKQAFKQSKQHKSSGIRQQSDLRRMSSFANQSWNADLGFSEKGVILSDLLLLTSASRLRCQAGYLLSMSKNRSIVSDSEWLDTFWSWIERAERISRDGNMTQDNIDLSYIGVYGIWMEEIAVEPRSLGGSHVPLTGTIKSLANRLNIRTKALCSTEYRAHRQLCLHISGLAWSFEELEHITKKLLNGNMHTKAAIIALFAGDEKLAHSALRSKTSSQTHKMLAMALAGSKQRRKTSASSSATEESGTEGDDDWADTISSLSADLTDPYARAILAYVKSGDWSDVLDIEAVPLKYRIGIALLHLDDNDLTAYIGRVTREVIEAGDIEGVILTGTGTVEGLGLLSSYARAFTDLQTPVLGLAAGGAAERFIITSNDRDTKAKRTVEAFQETYRAQIMAWGLKFDRVRFDIATSKAIASFPRHKCPRPKEQVRLVCTFCSGSLTQFPSNGTSSSASAPVLPQGPGIRVTDTAKHPLTPEKAAVLGTVCPKCGRHLPRCGVCDLWLGSPDESYAKWHISQQQQASKAAALENGVVGRSKQGSVDVPASMSGSVVTTIEQMAASSSTIKPITSQNADQSDNVDNELEAARRAEERWYSTMQKFTVFCTMCNHGFHAIHARLWFEGRNGQEGHRVCPVPGCSCQCNG